MVKWYVIRDGKRYGPFTVGFLYQLYDQGVVKEDYLVEDNYSGEKIVFFKKFDLSPDNVKKEAKKSEDHKTQEINIDLVKPLLKDVSVDNEISIPALPKDIDETIPELPQELEQPTSSTPSIPHEEDDIHVVSNEDLDSEDLFFPEEESTEFEELDNLDKQDESVPIQNNESEDKTKDLALIADNNSQLLNTNDQLEQVSNENTDLSNNNEVDNEVDKELFHSSEINDFENTLENEEFEEQTEEEPELEIVEREVLKRKVSKWIKVLLSILILIFILFIIMLLTVDVDDEKKVNLSMIPADKIENKSFESKFISADMFSKYQNLRNIIFEKSKDMDLLVDGFLFKPKRCYEANFVVLQGSERSELKSKFWINSIDKTHEKKVKFFKYKCVKHELSVSLETDIGFGKQMRLKAFYCPVFVDKATSFKKKYGLMQKCWNLKLFDECWDRVSGELKAQRPYEHITKENAAIDYVEMVTFITHEKVRAENSDAMKTIWECKK